MKNRILILFFACFFMIGSFAFTSIKGGIILPVIGKNGTTICTITLPDNYLNKSGQLVYPLEVIVYNGKIPVYAEHSEDLVFSLPPSFTGTYFIVIKIGDITFYEKIHL